MAAKGDGRIGSTAPRLTVAAGGPLLDVASIRALERDWLGRTPPGTLMRRAAAALAETVLLCRSDRSDRSDRSELPGRSPAEPVVLLVGPGNNGGDALLAGSLLQAQGVPVVAAVVDELRRSAPRAEDAARAWARWPTAQLRPFDALPALLGRWPRAIVVDGLFGIGLTRPIAGPLADVIAALAATPATVVAVDVPSGLDADRGVAVGGGAVVRADLTVTMIADKPGLHTGLGRAVAGRVRVAGLRAPVAGEPAGAARPLERPEVPGAGTLLTADAIRPLVPWRDDDAHKGSNGDVLVVGGRLGMGGAARLAARGALAGGAGRVWIAQAAAPGPVDPERPEIMRRPIASGGPLLGEHASAARAPVIVAGCGLGRDAGGRRWLQRVLAARATLVLDADALTLLAAARGRDGALRARSRRGDGLVLTPHPLEAARLLGTTVAAIAADRIGTARALADAHQAVVVLKGAGSIVAAPGGPYAINDSGHPLLATGGTGDVLAGLIGALAATAIASGDAPRYGAARAACVGTWAHGAAGEWLAREVGPFGVPAGRVAEALPAVWAGLA